MTTKENFASAGWVPKLIIAYFVVMIIGISSLAYIAAKSYPGVVSKNAFKNGVAYNDVLSKADQQAALGWRAQLKATKKADAAITIELALMGADGKALSGAEATLFLTRPASSKDDLTIKLLAAPEGYASAPLPLAAGIWKAEVYIRRQDKEFQHQQRLTIP